MPVTDWVCIKCGVVNLKANFKCATCQEAKPIFWECRASPACKTKNPIAALRCTGCRCKRPPMYTIKMGCCTNTSAAGTALPSPIPSTGTTGNAFNHSNVMNVGAGFSQITTNTTMTTQRNSALSAQDSKCSQVTSSVRQHVSSYDIFQKLNKPSRTVKAIEYVDSEDKYLNAIANCMRTNKSYIDTSFPPCSRSLYYVARKPIAGVKLDSTEKIYWLRPKSMQPPEIYDLKSSVIRLPWCVMRSPLSACDITQGQLGDCWLLSALAVLVEHCPALLDQVIATKELSSLGVYRIRLYRDGKRTSIVIDDYIPCNRKRLPIYSWAKRKQIFVPLIEKAAARMYGCYESLVSGQTTEGLSMLTGFPCRSIHTQVQPQPSVRMSNVDNKNKAEIVVDLVMLESDMIWSLMLRYHELGFPMGAGCGCDRESKVSADEYRSRGLMMQHAYSIISVLTIRGNEQRQQDERSQTYQHRLLQLRNPWGGGIHGYWNGDWSDSSDRWTPELRERLQPNKSNDGIFWICFEDFQRYFEKVDVCKIRDNWYEQRFEGFFPSSCADARYLSVFEIHVGEPRAELEFTLHQQSRRAVNLYRTQLLPMCVAIFQLKDMQRNIAGDLIDYSGYKIREFVGCDVVVDQGVYMVTVYAFNHWNQSTTKTGSSSESRKSSRCSKLSLRPPFVLSLHSSVRMTAVNCYCPTAAIIGDTLLEMAIKRGHQKRHHEYVVTYYLSKNWSGLVVVCENSNPDSFLEVVFDAAESINLYATRGSLYTRDTLPPRSRQLLNILSHMDPRTPYFLSYQFSYRAIPKDGSRVANHQPEIGRTLAPLHSARSFKQLSPCMATVSAPQPTFQPQSETLPPPPPQSQPPSQSKPSPQSQQQSIFQQKSPPKPQSQFKSQPQPTPSSKSQPQPQIQQKSPPKLQSQFKSQLQPAPSSKSQTQPQIQPKSPPKLQSQFKSQPQPTPSSKSQPQPQIQPKSQHKLQSQFKSQPQPTPSSKSQPKPQIQPKSQPKPQSQFKSQPQPKPLSKTQPPPQIQQKSKLKPQLKSQLQPFQSPSKSQPQFQPTSKSQPQFQPTSKSQPQFQPTSKSQPQFQPTSKSQPQFQPQLKSQPQF